MSVKKGQKKSEARQHLIQIARKHFLEKGLVGVAIKDIAKDAGIRHPTLYHHFPKGKEELYVTVIEEVFEEYQERLNVLIDETEDDLKAQIAAVAKWYASQPPIDFIRFVNQELPAIDPQSSEKLLNRSFNANMIPIKRILDQAATRGEIDKNSVSHAGMIFGAIQSLHHVPFDLDYRLSLVDKLVDLLVDGLKKR